MDSARNRIYECEEAAASANSEYDTARDFEDSTRKAYDESLSHGRSSTHLIMMKMFQ